MSEETADTESRNIKKVGDAATLVNANLTASKGGYEFLDPFDKSKGLRPIEDPNVRLISEAPANAAREGLTTYVNMASSPEKPGGGINLTLNDLTGLGKVSRQKDDEENDEEGKTKNKKKQK